MSGSEDDSGALRDEADISSPQIIKRESYLSESGQDYTVANAQRLVLQQIEEYK